MLDRYSKYGVIFHFPLTVFFTGIPEEKYYNGKKIVGNIDGVWGECKLPRVENFLNCCCQ